MTVRVRINLDKQRLQRDLRAITAVTMRARAESVGVLAVQQSRERFRNAGDDEIKWPDLWANTATIDDRATRDELERRSNKAAETLTRAKRKLKRAQDAGDVDAMRSARRSVQRAERKRDIADSEQAGGNTSFRRGGSPLRDTGALMSSMTFAVRNTERGATVDVGSPLPHAKFHQEGFSKHGLSFIPLSVRAKRKPAGVDPREFGLQPGGDFTYLRDVTVPARPMVRFSPENKRQITAALRQGGR